MRLREMVLKKGGSIDAWIHPFAFIPKINRQDRLTARDMDSIGPVFVASSLVPFSDQRPHQWLG